MRSLESGTVTYMGYHGKVGVRELRVRRILWALQMQKLMEA